MKKLTLVLLAAAAAATLAVGTAEARGVRHHAYRHHAHRHYAYSHVLTVRHRFRHHASEAGYRSEVLGRTPFGDTVFSGRMGLHRGGDDRMLPGSEDNKPPFIFIGSRS